MVTTTRRQEVMGSLGHGAVRSWDHKTRDARRDRDSGNAQDCSWGDTVRVAANWRKDRRRRIQRANRRLPSGAGKPETAMGRLTRCLAEFRVEVEAFRGRERQAWARVTDVEAFARVTCEKVDLVQEAGSRERLARLLVAEKMRTMKAEQRSRT